MLYFLANPTDLQELEESSQILANLCDIDWALGTYFYNGIKKVSCRTLDCLMLCRFYVLMLPVPQQFAAFSFYNFLEMFIVRIIRLQFRL